MQGEGEREREREMHLNDAIVADREREDEKAVTREG